MKKTNSTFSRRLRTGGLAGTLGVIFAAGVPPLTTVNGAIIYSGIQNLYTSRLGTPVNVDNAGGPEFSLQSTPGKAVVSPGGWVTPPWQPAPQQPPPYYAPAVIHPANYVSLISSGGLDFLITTPPVNANHPVALLGEEAPISLRVSAPEDKCRRFRYPCELGL